MSATAPLLLPAPPPVGADWALFLDVDGCLLDFADRPEDVQVPPDLAQDLHRLRDALGGALAFVSGRPVHQLDSLFAPLRIPAAGLHGLELREHADQSLPAAEVPAALGRVRRDAERMMQDHPGARVEDKGVALALHWRTAPQAREALQALAGEVLPHLPGYRLQQGNCVVELRPDGSDKGSAVERLMRAAPFAGRVPVYAGDDFTDEDGFDAANRLGGLSIIVGDRRPTGAIRALPDTTALRRWIADAARRLGAPA